MSPSYKGHRYPVEAISHCVWLYFRFPLGFRQAEELMLERGVIVSYETVRRWCLELGQQYASGLHRRRSQPGDGPCAGKPLNAFQIAFEGRLTLADN
jgi:putative transposase